MAEHHIMHPGLIENGSQDLRALRILSGIYQLFIAGDKVLFQFKCDFIRLGNCFGFPHRWRGTDRGQAVGSEQFADPRNEEIFLPAKHAAEESLF